MTRAINNSVLYYAANAEEPTRDQTANPPPFSSQISSYMIELSVPAIQAYSQFMSSPVAMRIKQNANTGDWCLIVTNPVAANTAPTATYPPSVVVMFNNQGTKAFERRINVPGTNATLVLDVCSWDRDMFYAVGAVLLTNNTWRPARFILKGYSDNADECGKVLSVWVDDVNGAANQFWSAIDIPMTSFYNEGAWGYEPQIDQYKTTRGKAVVMAGASFNTVPAFNIGSATRTTLFGMAYYGPLNSATKHDGVAAPQMFSTSPGGLSTTGSWLSCVSYLGNILRSSPSEWYPIVVAPYGQYTEYCSLKRSTTAVPKISGYFYDSTSVTTWTNLSGSVWTSGDDSYYWDGSWRIISQNTMFRLYANRISKQHIVLHSQDTTPTMIYAGSFTGGAYPSTRFNNLYGTYTQRCTFWGGVTCKVAMNKTNLWSSWGPSVVDVGIMGLSNYTNSMAYYSSTRSDPGTQAASAYTFPIWAFTHGTSKSCSVTFHEGRYMLPGGSDEQRCGYSAIAMRRSSGVIAIVFMPNWTEELDWGYATITERTETFGRDAAPGGGWNWASAPSSVSTTANGPYAVTNNAVERNPQTSTNTAQAASAATAVGIAVAQWQPKSVTGAGIGTPKI